MGAIPKSDLPGHTQLHERVVAALARSQESRDVDFKESATWDQLRPSIIKTAMAMANLRDGGVIVIGVSERGGVWNLTGVSVEHLKTFDPDIVMDAVNAHASPPVQLDIVVVDHDGCRFLAVHAHEFEEAPVVCRKAGPKLTVGDILVRPIGKAESTRVREAREMHELLELAAEKRARRILGTSQRLGLELPGTAENRYEGEIRAAPETFVASLAQKPHWRLIIRANDYTCDRIKSLSEAWDLIEQLSVHWSGWQFPVVPRDDEYRKQGSNWISYHFKSSDDAEEWKLFQSGQFVCCKGVKGATPGPTMDRLATWAKGHDHGRPPVDWDRIVGYMGLRTTIRTLTEVVEFAARLCDRGTITGSCHLHLSLLGAKGIMLTTDTRRFWPCICIASANELSHTWTLRCDQLVADRVSPAVDTAIWFFERFGWTKPARDLIAADVADFRGGG